MFSSETDLVFVRFGLCPSLKGYNWHCESGHSLACLAESQHPPEQQKVLMAFSVVILFPPNEILAYLFAFVKLY